MPFDMDNILAPINFSVETRPVYDAQGRKIDPDLARGVYREDTGECISIVGRNFRPIQHMDVMEPIIEHVQRMGVDVHERPANTSNLYDIRGKSGALIQSFTESNGAVMRTDIVFGDFIEPKPRDTMFFRLSVLNSHNMKYAVRVNASYVRLICLNGMVRPDYSVQSFGKHTHGFNIEGLQSKIDNSLLIMDSDNDQYRRWAQTPLTMEKAREFIEKTLAKLPPEKGKPKDSFNSSGPLTNKILNHFQNEDQTVFGLWNAMTYWSTHDDLRSNSGEISGRVNRENRVASALRSREFAELA